MIAQHAILQDVWGQMVAVQQWRVDIAYHGGQGS
jgi:hypothetical protein